jgi:hypothetical protein
MSDISDFAYSPTLPQVQDFIDICLVMSVKKNVDLPMDRQYLSIMGIFYALNAKDSMYELMHVDQGAQIFKKSRRHLEILGVRRVK